MCESEDKGLRVPGEKVEELVDKSKVDKLVTLGTLHSVSVLWE